MAEFNDTAPTIKSLSSSLKKPTAVTGKESGVSIFASSLFDVNEEILIEGI